MHRALDLKQSIDFQLESIVAEYVVRFEQEEAELRKCIDSFLQCYGPEIGRRIARMTRDTLFKTVLEGVDDQQAVTNHVINASSTVVRRLRNVIGGSVAA